MPHCIIFHFACSRKIHIQFCIYYRLFIPYRIRNIMSVRVYYAAAAATHHVRQTISALVFRSSGYDSFLIIMSELIK